MGAGDLFGEMTCMSFYPRSATVRAAEDCTRAGDAPQRALHHAAQPDVPPRSWRRSTASGRSTPTCGACRSSPRSGPTRRRSAGSSTSCATAVTLRRCEPGEVIFRQGAPAADGLLPRPDRVRQGLADAARRRAGAELRRPGRLLRRDRPALGHARDPRLAPAGIRTATCTALDHVDLVRITAADFRDDRRPIPRRVRSRGDRRGAAALEANRDARTTSSETPLGAFLAQGLMEAQSLLVLDLEKCTRCDECTKACADAHQGVTRLIREGLRFDKFLVASSCRSCLDPYCMVGCPVGSIRRRETARDHHRGLVHRLRHVRRELPVRQHQHGSDAATTSPGRPT